MHMHNSGGVTSALRNLRDYRDHLRSARPLTSSASQQVEGKITDDVRIFADEAKYGIDGTQADISRLSDPLLQSFSMAQSHIQQKKHRAYGLTENTIQGDQGIPVNLGKTTIEKSQGLSELILSFQEDKNRKGNEAKQWIRLAHSMSLECREMYHSHRQLERLYAEIRQKFDKLNVAHNNAQFENKKLRLECENHKMAVKTNAAEVHELKQAFNTSNKECDRLRQKLKQLQSQSIEMQTTGSKAVEDMQDQVWILERRMVEQQQTHDQEVKKLEVNYSQALHEMRIKHQTEVSELEQSLRTRYENELQLQSDRLRTAVRDKEYVTTKLQSELTDLRSSYDKLKEKYSTKQETFNADQRRLTSQLDKWKASTIRERSRLAAKEVEIQKMRESYAQREQNSRMSTKSMKPRASNRKSKRSPPRKSDLQLNVSVLDQKSISARHVNPGSTPNSSPKKLTRSSMSSAESCSDTSPKSQEKLKELLMHHDAFKRKFDQKYRDSPTRSAFLRTSDAMQVSPRSIAQSPNMFDDSMLSEEAPDET